MVPSCEMILTGRRENWILWLGMVASQPVDADNKTKTSQSVALKFFS
jgi:hypothetical protein